MKASGGWAVRAEAHARGRAGEARKQGEGSRGAPGGAEREHGQQGGAGGARVLGQEGAPTPSAQAAGAQALSLPAARLLTFLAVLGRSSTSRRGV